MTGKLYSLRVFGTCLLLAAFFVGLASTWLWMRSDAAWQAHLTRAQFTGASLFGVLSDGAPEPAGVNIQPLSDADNALADRGEFEQISGIPRPAIVTNVSILEAPSPGVSGHELVLAVVASELRYPLSALSVSEQQGAAETLGALTRVMASFCSDPVILARVDGAEWVRVDGLDIWGCEAAPTDLRLAALFLAFVGLGGIATLFLNMIGLFDRFAELLRSRRRLGGPESYDSTGPEELRDIVAAVNSYLEAERVQLEKRAIVLSGVSHDLGTPATRLRLRAALIDDPELRNRLESDIDQMTGIIESVLTFTRTEINSEEPRQISLSSLVEALVADYSDTGQPVEFRRTERVTAKGGRSVFMSRQGHGAVPDERRVVVTVRPVSLQRALSNLIDNALKYGRRATVELQTDADIATIVVEDEGSDYSPSDLEDLVSPFRRGGNTGSVHGFGLGLTIVASIANMHGGALTFEHGANGIRARLSIQRN